MASLDMALDDIIKRNKSESGRGRGKARRGQAPGGSGAGRPAGQPRRGPLGVRSRPTASTIPKSSRRTDSMPWQRGLIEESLKALGIQGFENGTKLYVSNLDTGVSNEDIRELFSEFGELKRYAIHYDKNGRPSGSAEVMFARRSDAVQAVKRYNNVMLDGKSMRIEIVGSNSEAPVRMNVVGGPNGRRKVVMMAGAGRGRGAAAFKRVSGQRSRRDNKNGRGGAANGNGGMANARGVAHGRGGGGGRGRNTGRGRGRGRGSGGKKAVDKSADELDKELENYMQT